MPRMVACMGLDLLIQAAVAALRRRNELLAVKPCGQLPLRCAGARNTKDAQIREPVRARPHSGIGTGNGPARARLEASRMNVAITALSPSGHLTPDHRSDKSDSSPEGSDKKAAP